MKTKNKLDNDMLPEYEPQGGVRGKYYNKYQKGTNIVKLDQDVAKAFTNSKSVNNSLRALITIYKENKIKP